MATGRGAVRGHAAVGEVVDTAARLLRSSDRSMSAAATAGVLMDLLSAQLLAGRFALSTQPDGAIRLHAELDEDASRPLLGKPTPCVGREVELGHLEAQLAACIEESEARAMLLTAPPGAGKSRLRHEFLRRVQKQSQPLTVLLGRGDILSAGAPYGILRAALHKLCGICGSEPLDTQRARLQTRIGRHVTPLHAERIVLFIGELCNVPFPKEGKPMLQAAHQDPKIMRECLRRAFLDFLAAEGAAAPVLLVLDDLQWADPLTVSVLDAALRELAGAPLFVLAFARPELHGTFPKLWKGHTVQELQLKGLSKKACERLITQVLGKEVLPDVIASAIEQSAGNALFLEEIIRSIAEGKAASRVETVVAMLQARLGRLDGNLRKTVRAAAIFGQTFWRAGVAALLGLAEEAPELDVWLPALVDAEVAEPHPQSRLANQSEYRFRHALVRDAAYSLLTTSDQQTGHRLAGRFLESAGESDTAAIADHFERGADCQSAVRWYRRAVAQAIRSGDYDSAIHLGDRAISLGASGDDLATIRILQALAYYWTGRHFIGERCAREVVLQQPAGSELRYYAVCMAVMGASQIGLFDDYRAEVEDFLAFTPPAEGARRHLYRLAILPFTLFCISEYRLITDILARLDSLSHVVPSDPVRHAYRVYMQANVHFYLDADPWKAVALDRQALALFEQLGDLSMVHTTRGVLALHALGLGDVEAAAPLWREALENRDVSSISTESWFHYARLLYLAQTENFSEVPAAGTAAMDRLSTVDSLVVRCPSMIALAYALSGMNELAQAEHWARAAVALTQRLPGLRCFALAVLARALVNQHRPAEALAAAREARALLLQHGPPYDREPLVHLAFAEALYASGEVGAARAAIAEAMERLLRRAAAIPNQADQQRFFANVPEHARTQELHRRWLGTESSR